VTQTTVLTAESDLQLLMERPGMASVSSRAADYLEKLEADRLAAIAISERKAEEAKLIAAHREGFEAAMEILADAISAGNCDSRSGKAGRRRQRRDISELILRELSFSGEAMTTRQIAKAIDYLPERTESALQRLGMGGRLVREEDGRWAAVNSGVAKPIGHVPNNWKSPTSTRAGAMRTTAPSGDFRSGSLPATSLSFVASPTSETHDRH